MTRIVIVGGYGAFGARVAERLAAGGNHEIVIAGRSAARAAEAVGRLAARSRMEVTSAVLDAATATPADLIALGARVVVNAAGPFQRLDYALARACIAARCHYVDLADARAFVTGITVLDAEARAAGICVVSGASTVPGLSSAVVAAHRGGFAALDAIDIGVSPGNHFDPGLATTASILGYVGQPIGMRIGGRDRTVYGWQGLERVAIAGIGPRLMSYAEVPDLDLFPAADSALRSVRMMAGVEVPLFHLGLSAASWLVRLGLVRDLAAWAPLLLGLKRRLSFLGTNRGGMFVGLTGSGPDGQRRRLVWSLAARRGHGPYVPALPSVILARRLADGATMTAGAMACFDMFTLAEFMEAAAGLDITATVETVPQ